MRQRYVSFLAVFSLVCGIGLTGMWIRSLWSTDLVYFTCGPAFCQLCSQDSTIYVEITIDCRPFSCAPHFSSQPSGQTQPASTFNWRTLGFGWVSTIINYAGMPPGLRYRVLRLPDWFLVAMTGVMAIVWAIRRRRRRLYAQKGFCIQCGYDLRASKDRCPECGTPITTGAMT